MRMRLLQIITEATRPYVQKVVDPALMTFDEYRQVANPSNSSHPSSAYDVDLKKLNSYHSADQYENLLNTITRNGIVFEVRENARDRWKSTVVKTDPDGDIVRDESGIAVYMDEAELQLAIPEEVRFHYDYAIIDKDTQQVAGVTADEWGTLLVQVAREYRNFGFGTQLVKLARDRQPTRNSGGFTNAGLNNLRRVWSEMVREYISSGFYSHLVKTDQITTSRVKEITSGVSAKKTHTPVNYNTSDPKDWLLMSDGQSFALLYDKKIYDMDDVDDTDMRMWVDRHIIGFANLGSYGTDSPPWVHRTHGSDKVKAYLMGILFNQEINNPIRLDDAEYALLSKSQPLQEWPTRTGDQQAYFIDQPTISGWQAASRAEARIRKKVDPYQEWYARIIQWAESLGKI